MQLVRRLSREYIVGCRQWRSPRVLRTSKLHWASTSFLHAVITLPDHHVLYQSQTDRVSRRLSTELGQLAWRFEATRVLQCLQKSCTVPASKWLRRKSLVRCAPLCDARISDPVGIDMTWDYAVLPDRHVARVVYVVVLQPWSRVVANISGLMAQSLHGVLHIPLQLCDDTLQAVQRHIGGEILQ